MIEYGAGAPTPGTSRLFAGAPPSTKHVWVDGDATTRTTSFQGSRNRFFTSSASSSTTTSSRQVGEPRYAAPSAMPIAPVAIGTSTAPIVATAIAVSAPPVPIAVQATPR